MKVSESFLWSQFLKVGLFSSGWLSFASIIHGFSGKIVNSLMHCFLLAGLVDENAAIVCQRYNSVE
jgi:hypothetical protein